MRSLSSWSSALFSGSNSSLVFKATYSNQRVLAHTLKVAILTSYKNLSVGYIELKLHIYALGTSDTYFTSCKKGHNRSPLKIAKHTLTRAASIFYFRKHSALRLTSRLLLRMRVTSGPYTVHTWDWWQSHLNDNVNNSAKNLISAKKSDLSIKGAVCRIDIQRLN